MAKIITQGVIASANRFGSYKTSYEVKNGELVYRRSLTQRAARIPANQYQVLRSFFERIRAAEQAPVVLTRK